MENRFLSIFMSLISGVVFALWQDSTLGGVFVSLVLTTLAIIKTVE